MKAKNLQEMIESLTDDIEFQYNGRWGAICPFSHTEITVSYDGEEKTFSSAEDVMKQPFVDGKPLKDICHKFII